MRKGSGFRSLALAVLAGLVALAPAALPTSAGALSSPTPWDGSNPFNCTIQDAGFGPTGPDPGADPYCVRFNKTHQNVTRLGIVQFLSQEPARSAAAVPKCFYFQEDHWRGSLVQSTGTALYEFEGHYFFNKATGDGGVWVTDFTVDGKTFDPTTLPGFPPGYGQDFGPGTGGFITHDEVPVDPACVALAKRSPSPIYPSPSSPRCVLDAGRVGSQALGPLTVGAGENAVRAELGPPEQVKRGFLRYCVDGGGSLLVGQPGNRSGTLGSGGDSATVILVTTAKGFLLNGRGRHTLAVGADREALHRAFPHIHRLQELGGTRVLRARRSIVLGERHGHISLLAVYDPRLIKNQRQLTSFLRRSQ